MSDLEWKNLCDFACPKCESLLQKGILEYKCMNKNCDFHIRKKRFDEIVQSIYDNEEPDWSGYDYD